MKPTLSDVMSRLEAQYVQRTAPPVDLGAFDKLAAHLRTRTPEPCSYDVLAEAISRGFVASLASTSEAEQTHELHKLAQAVRNEAWRETQTAYDTAANTLYAAQALTLLRDRIMR